MVVVVTFVFCNVLAMVSNMLDAFKIEAVPITQVSNLLVTINSSINLFVYCAFGKRFRSELRNLIKVSLKLTKFQLCSKQKIEVPLNTNKDRPKGVYHCKNMVTIRVNISDENTAPRSSKRFNATTDVWYDTLSSWIFVHKPDNFLYFDFYIYLYFSILYNFVCTKLYCITYSFM